MKKNFMKAAALTGTYVIMALISSCSKDPVVRQRSYTLTANGASGVSGSVNITEQTNKNFSIAVGLDKSIKDTLHLVKVYSGRINQAGPEILDLGTVKGTGGNISIQKYSLDSIIVDGQKKAMTYDSIINYNAYVQVLFSASRPDSILSRGNIGKQ